MVVMYMDPLGKFHSDIPVLVYGAFPGDIRAFLIQMKLKPGVLKGLYVFCFSPKP